jgi:fatty-acyl-CoA synthase
MTELPCAYWPADRSSPILDMTVGELLREAVADASEATALVEGAARPADRRRWTYAEVLEQAERTARALLGRFEPGERVAVWASNIPEWVLFELAAGLAGITLVTVNPALRAEELTHVLGQSQATGVFLVPRYRGTPMADLLAAAHGGLPRLREVVLFSDWAEFGASGSPTQRLPRVGPADSAQVQYTSGTTGLPKGAVLHHRGIVNNARLTVERLGLVTGRVRCAIDPGVRPDRGFSGHHPDRTRRRAGRPGSHPGTGPAPDRGEDRRHRDRPDRRARRHR